MKLDPRIIEGKRPLSCLDTEEAKQFIGKKGYFAGDLSIFKNLDYFDKWTLQEIKDDPCRCFKDGCLGEWWYYFLPEEWVQEQEPEPVWRPYDLDTLREDKMFLGDVVTFRRKTEDGSARIITAIYNGKSENSDDLDDSEILLGGEWFGFQRLFEEYEIFDSAYGDSKICRWRPFGYQE